MAKASRQLKVTIFKKDEWGLATSGVDQVCHLQSDAEAVVVVATHPN